MSPLSVALLAAVFLTLLIWLLREFFLKKAFERRLQQKTQELQKNALKLKQRVDQTNLDNLALSQYLLNYSEQLRSPLQVMMETERWLETPATEMETGMRRLRLSQAVDEMQSLVEHALSLSVKHSGETTLFHQHTNLHDLLLKVKQSLNKSFENKSLAFSVKLASNVPEQVILDTQRLMQILLNLVANTAENNRSGKIEIMLKQLTRENNIARVLFSVSDVTSASTAAQQSLHFDQTDFEITEVSELDTDSPGLAISQRLVTLMGGRLRLERHHQLGRRYYFSLPIKLAESTLTAKPDKPESVAETAAEKPRQYPLKSMVLLLATADQQRRLLFSGLLTGKGATVDSVGDGKQAIQALLHGQRLYDALIVDLDMPKMNGIQTTVEIRDFLQLNDLPVFGIDADNDASLQTIAEEAGITACFVCPLNELQVIDALSKAV